MSIQGFIKRVCKQTAVYWGNPQNDGFGGMTFNYPIEIACRWTDKERIFTSNDGIEIHQKAEVLVTQDLKVQGWLYLGALDDVLDFGESSGDPISPKEVNGAYQIIGFDKVPEIFSTTKFVHTAYLGFGTV